MPRNDLEAMSKDELIRELEKLESADRRFAAKTGEADRERLIHDLHVHQVELEMQNRELREAQDRLEEVTARYAELYEFAPVGYCTIDPEGRIREINLTATTLLGGPRASLVGSSFSSVAPLEDKGLFQSHMRRCAREEGRVTSELTFSGGRRGTRTVQIISDPVRDRAGAKTGHRTILVDISDLKALEGRLRLLSTSGEKLTPMLEHAATIQVAARIAVPALADLCMIDVASEPGNVRREVVLFADATKQAPLAERLMQSVPQRGWQTPQARVIASGEPMLLSEVSAELRAHASDDGTWRAADIRSLMVVPLSARGRTFGALTLASAESDWRYSSVDLQVAQDLASRIAMALDNARLYEEARRANEALRLSEARASGIVSIAAEAIICGDEHLRITLFNEAAEQIFGRSRAEAMGASLEALVPERLRSGYRREVERFAAGRPTSRKMGDTRHAITALRENGEEFPAVAAVSKLEIAGEAILTIVLRDVTDEKRLEREQALLAEVGLVLAGSLDFEATLTRIADLAVRDLADFCIVDLVGETGEMRRLRVVCRDPASKTICDALKRIPADSTRLTFGSSPLEAARPVLVERVTPEFIASSAGGDEHLAVLREMAPRSLIVVPLVVRGKISGRLTLVSAREHRTYGQADLRLAEEIASRAALAIENARLYRVAERAIEARDAVLGVVAHDLRSPLSGILMQAALLRRPEGQDRRSRKPADAIERAATRMNRLIQDLLDVTSMEAGHLSIEKHRVAAGKTIAEFVESQTPLAQAASVEIALEVSPDLGEIFADRERLLQVLENLVGNAVKFTPRGGRVTIGARRSDEEALFWVADTGPGIEPSFSTHVFDRFWQERKARGRGVGLGLPIVKGIVEAHGGRVWVESEVGAGTTFFFTLPLGRPAAAARSSEPARFVLLAEDDPDVRDGLRATLELTGYRVVTANNGAEALEYLRHGAHPSLVILDLRMPIMDGWAFLRERNSDPELRALPVIVLTGELGIEARLEAAHASYLKKPVRPERLIEIIERAVPSGAIN